MVAAVRCVRLTLAVERLSPFYLPGLAVEFAEVDERAMKQVVIIKCAGNLQGVAVGPLRLRQPMQLLEAIAELIERPAVFLPQSALLFATVALVSSVSSASLKWA
jgi:hypothetical protein